MLRVKHEHVPQLLLMPMIQCVVTVHCHLNVAIEFQLVSTISLMFTVALKFILLELNGDIVRHF